MTPEQTSELLIQQWTVVERPGYLGSRRDAKYKEWDKKYGAGNWRIGYELGDGRKVTFKYLFLYYELGYARYFIDHPKEAVYIADNFSYAYDETIITLKQAFDPLFLMEKEGFSNQFHHVALNKAITEILGFDFKGKRPLQVRMGKNDTPKEKWPSGWKWHPGSIPCTDYKIIPVNVNHQNKWWDGGSIEDLYQSAKVLEVKVK